MTTTATTVLAFPGSPQKVICVNSALKQPYIDAGWIENANALRKKFFFVNSDEGLGIQATLTVLPMSVLLQTALEWDVAERSALARDDLVLAILSARGYVDSANLEITGVTSSGGLDVVIHGTGFQVGLAGDPTITAGPGAYLADSFTVVDDSTINATLSSDSGHTGDVIDISVTNAYGTHCFVHGFTVPS